jgi:hypothetical protein
MLENTIDFLKDQYKINDDVIKLYIKALKDVEEEFKYYDEIR